MDINSRFIQDNVQILTTHKILSEEDAGKVFYLNLATGFTVTLPRIINTGSRFPLRFVVKTAPSSGTYVITENAAFDTDSIIVNGINELEVDDSEDGPYNAGCTTVTFADGVAVAGDYVDFDWDGEMWYCTGQTKADGGITLA